VPNTHHRLIDSFKEATHQLAVRLKLEFAYRSNKLPPFAVRWDSWEMHSRKALQSGNTDPLLLSIMTSALSGKHTASGLDRLDYLYRMIDFYKSGNVDNLLKANNSSFDLISKHNVDRKHIRHVAKTSGLEEAKIECLLHDIEYGSDGKISAKTMGSLISFYDETNRRSGARDEYNSSADTTSKTYSAFDKKYLHPLIRALYKAGRDEGKTGYVSEEQIVLVLSANLHSREFRRTGERYFDHPMSVAKLVKDNAEKFGFSAANIRLAVMAALLHDIGEKSNYDVWSDLNGVVSTNLITKVQALHKKDGEDYFHYIERLANDPITALVKLCDLYHNTSDDSALDKPSFKQKYIYPIAANYLKCRLENPAQRSTIREFVEMQGKMPLEKFDRIAELALKNHKVAVAEVYDNLGEIGKWPSISEALTPSKKIAANANTRREENPPAPS
jgi:hypothetical protein